MTRDKTPNPVSLQQLLSEAEALYNGSRAISSSLSEHQILDALIKQIRLHNPCEVIAYRLSSVDGEAIWAEVREVWHKNSTPTHPVKTNIYLPDSPQKRLLALNEPLFIKDIATDPRLSAEERASFAPMAARSAAILPLSFIGQKIGVVIVSFTTPFTFTEVSRRFWITMSDQASMALHNRQLIQEAAYRAIQMETAAEVARAASSLLDVDELLNSAVALIRDRFELYYAGAFLVDNNGDWAVLKAGTGQPGQQMLQENYRLKINGNSMIGQSIQTRRPKIALDVGKDAALFQHPHLPDTRSEIALPLVYHQRAIGALTIHSSEPAAFKREDLIFLQTMADQLANAIENARLFEQTQQDLAERQRVEEALETWTSELEEATIFLDSIIENIPSGIFIKDATTGRYIRYNKTQEQWVGLDRNEVIGKTDRELVSAEQAQLRIEQDQKVLETGEMLDIPHSILRSSTKQERIVHTRKVPIFGVDGKPRYVLGISEDITDNTRAEQEILRRNQELAAINRITTAITISHNPQEQLREILREMVQMLGACRSGLALLNQDEATLTLAGYYSVYDDDPDLTGITIPIENNPSTQHVINTRQSLMISDPKTNPLTAPMHDTWADVTLECILIVPLIARGKVIGTFGFDLDKPGRVFATSDIQMAETIARQIAGALENVHLLEQTQAALNDLELAQAALSVRERYLAAQLQIQNMLLAARESASPYADVLKILGQVSGASRVYIFENHYNSDNQLLTSQKAEWCGKGITPEIDNPDLQNLPLVEVLPRWVETLAKGEAIAGRVAEFPQSERDILEPQQIQAILVLPLMVSSSFFGFIGFDNCASDRPWDISEQDLLSAAAAAVSLWHERHRAEEGLVVALQRTESLYSIGNIMAAATDLEPTFEKVLVEYLGLLNIHPAYGSLILFEHDKGYSKVQTLIVEGQPVESNLSFPASQDKIANHLQQQPEAFVIGNIHTHPFTKDNLEFWQQDKAVRSMLFIPMTQLNRVIGVIAVGSRTPDYPFSAENIEIGQVVTDQLAIWLENRQLLAESRYRSERLQTAAIVSQAASSILDVNELINTSVNLIRDHFKFYYVGLFLVDEAGEWAVLRAGTGRAGRIQLARNHRLKIGGESMIGWSVANRKARIALDVGEEAVHFRNPILPDTHSEMALPLISRDEVIGALTVQSTERGAFSDEDITLLQTMTDQLANALANARLFESVAQAQREAEQRLHETTALQTLSQNLAVSLDLNDILGVFFKACVNELAFEYMQLSLVDKARQRVAAIGGMGVTENHLKKSSQPLSSDDIMADIIRTGKTEIITGWDSRFNRELFDEEGHDDWVRLFTPVTLRHEHIGLVEAGFNKTRQTNITDAQIRLLKAFINQTALAIDNAQRYQASLRAAKREALIKEITTKVRASNDLNTILQTTVKEVGSAIPSKRAFIRLKTPQPSNGSSALKHVAVDGTAQQEGGLGDE